MAAKTIKGITVEIGGNTTDLQKSIDSVSKKSKDLQSELKKVDSALKLDPKNTELLAQKQDILKEKIGATKEKLVTLKSASEQVRQQYEKGEIDSGQYRAFQREIETAENQLKELEKTAKRIPSSMDGIADGCEKIGGKVSGAGKSLIPASAAVTGLGAIAVKTGADFDSAMSKVAAVSGATGEDLESLREKAREMGSNTKFSASEAADAMNYMAMAGWKTPDMLSGIDGIMSLAAASGEDLATTSDIVTDALTAFGLTAADSGHFSDVLAAASSNANTNVSMMGETFKYCAPIAGALGFNCEDTAEAIGLMANSGIKSEHAGTSLRSIMTSLAGDVKICGESIGEVEIQTSNADGSMRGLSDILADCKGAFTGLSESEQAAAAESLVGKDAMSGFLALMNSSDADIEKLSGAIENCDGTSEKMAETMQDNLNGQMTILKSQLEELAISFSEILMPVIRKIVSKIQDLVDKFNGLGEGTKKTITKIALFVATAGPVLIVIGKVIAAVGKIIGIASKVIKVIKLVKSAIAVLNAVMLANPVILIVAGIVALIAIFVVLWKKCDAFRNFWIGLWDGIKKAFGAVVNWIKENWKTMLLFLVNPLAGVFKYLYDHFEGFRNFVNGVVTAIKTFFTNLWDNIVNAASAAWNAIKAVFSAVVGYYKMIFTAAWDVVKGIFSAIGGFFADRWNDVVTVFSAVVGFFKDVFTNAWDAIKNVFSAVGDFFGGVWDTIKSKFVGIAVAIGDAVSGAFKTAVNGVLSVVESVLNNLPKIINGALGLINKIPGVDIQWRMKDFDLPRMAKGGIVKSGSAIFAEAGPEMLSVVNGAAYVTPLSGSSKNTEISGINSGKNSTVNNYFSISAEIKNDYDVKKLCYQMAFEASKMQKSKGLIGGEV